MKKDKLKLVPEKIIKNLNSYTTAINNNRIIYININYLI